MLTSYSVSAAALFEAFPTHDWWPRLAPAMGEVARRFAVRNRSILSLGSRKAYEERHLTPFGNRLTLVDIDEQGDIRPVLETLPAGELRYLIADANTLTLDGFDVLYVSGFTPDELERAKTLNDPTPEDRARMMALEGRWTWPRWRMPFHSTIMRLARQLPDGGLLIVQSYYGGLDASAHPHYLPAVASQLEAAGLTLQEVYRFGKIPGVMLYAASRGAVALCEPPLAMFHGRAEAPDAAVRIYPEARSMRAA